MYVTYINYIFIYVSCVSTYQGCLAFIYDTYKLTYMHIIYITKYMLTYI